VKCDTKSSNAPRTTIIPPMLPASMPNIKSTIAQPKCPTYLAPIKQIIPSIKPIIPEPNAPIAPIGEKKARKGDDKIEIKLKGLSVWRQLMLKYSLHKQV